MRLKVCGITDPREIDLLRHLAMDFVGVWHGLEGGHADLPFDEYRRLVGRAQATGTLKPVLVTFVREARELRRVVEESGVEWVQLHGYQPPSLVRQLKDEFGDRVKVVKVLHVQGRRCLEQPLIRAYEAAGTNIFMLDAATDGGRIGSTGHTLDSDVVRAIADRLHRPFFLAGGLRPGGQVEHALSVRHPRFFGIDVDTAARDADRRICKANVEALIQAWVGAGERGPDVGDTVH